MLHTARRQVMRLVYCNAIYPIGPRLLIYHDFGNVQTQLQVWRFQREHRTCLRQCVSEIVDRIRWSGLTDVLLYGLHEAQLLHYHRPLLADSIWGRSPM